GRRQVVRNGHLPARKLLTGLGQMEVRQPRVHDRGSADQSEKFTSKILPPYLRKTKSLEELIPWLYLKGISTGDMSEALTALVGGPRESEQSWRALLLDCQSRGMVLDPKVAVGDGGLGFWKALPQVWPTTRPQRCWVHKTANVLDKLPKSQQPQAKGKLHDIYLAATRADAEKAFDLFLDTY